MVGPDPAVAAVRAAVRNAVRAAVCGLEPDAASEGVRVLVACSGGADSLALAAATAFVAPRQGFKAGLVTVDHGLQDGSAARAQSVVRWGRQAGLDPVLVATVTVAGRPGGPEAAARAARYQALTALARQHRCDAVLLGHTRDDQAETVLLALVRGSGLRGIAAMPVACRRDGVLLVRPLLDVGRAQTNAACAALGLDPWADPHNADPAFARTRARALLSSLVDSLGPAVVTNLAHTAALAAADAEALDALAHQALLGAGAEGCLRTEELEGLPSALRGRVLHAWARSLGAGGSALNRRHVAALDALVVGWRGQGPVHLPGGIRVHRNAGLLRVLPGSGGAPGAAEPVAVLADRAG